MQSTEYRSLNAEAENARAEAKPASEKIQAAYKEYREVAVLYKDMWEPAVFLDEIAPKIQTLSVKAKTDPDGRFSVKAPRVKRIALFPRAKRQVFDKTEDYLWFVWVTPANSKSVMLSNDNLVETSCQDCVDFRQGLRVNSEVADLVHKLWPEFPTGRR